MLVFVMYLQGVWSTSWFRNVRSFIWGSIKQSKLKGTYYWQRLYCTFLRCANVRLLYLRGYYILDKTLSVKLVTQTYWSEFCWLLNIRWFWFNCSRQHGLPRNLGSLARKYKKKKQIRQSHALAGTPWNASNLIGTSMIICTTKNQ